MASLRKSEPMYILGINAYHGDVSAVLLEDGRVVAAVEEERFRRIKHYAGFPTNAIRSCLQIAGIDGSAVSDVAISRDPKAHFQRKVAFALSHPRASLRMTDRLTNARKVSDVRGPLAAALKVAEDKLPRFHNVEHHPAHLASSFFVSPFSEAAVCAIDGFGDFVSTSLGHGEDRQITVREHVFYPHSLGLFYTAITQYLGFLGYGDEFKIMGLAPYGKPVFKEPLQELVRLHADGLFTLEQKFFRTTTSGIHMEWEDGYPDLGIVYTDELQSLLGPARDPNTPLTERDENLAASVQAVFEDAAFHILNHLYETTKSPRVCLAGGCAMNSVMNGKVRARTPFQQLYVQPASADNGTALGAAYWVWHHVHQGERGFVMDHGYWGPEYIAVDVPTSFNGADNPEFQIEHCADEETLCRTTAQLLAAGNVVGWYQGRMEWGARALGNRSILADPRRSDMRDLINTKIKFREKFRPFAPSVMEEALGDYFVDAVPDPFMLQVYQVRPEKQRIIPAITHVDGSGRLQTVNESQNRRYYRLIREFANITGVPIVLNTSFNENEPIVNTPEEALDCFARTRMDAIVINNMILRRRSAAAPVTTGGLEINASGPALG